MVDKNKFLANKPQDGGSVKEVLDEAVRRDGVPSDSDEFDLSSMYDPRSKYTPEQKMQAVMAYVATGTSRQAQKYCIVPEETIRWWKHAAHWWPEAVHYAKQVKQEELDAKLTGVIDSAVEQLHDRILNGDEVLTKEGDTRRKKMSGREIAMTMGIAYDKRGMIRTEAVGSSHKESIEESLEKLADKFQQFSEELERNRTAKIIDGERIED